MNTQRLFGRLIAALSLILALNLCIPNADAQQSKKNGGQGGFAWIKYTSQLGIKSIVRQRIASDWSCGSNAFKKHATIEFCISDDGNIYNPVITEDSLDEQYNANCLEACCNLTPLDVSRQPGVKPIEQFSISFGKAEDLPPKFHGAEILEYQRNHNLPSGADCGIVLVHKIPLDVLNRYPGMFNEKELLAPQNLIAIPIEGASLHNSGARGKCLTYVSAISALYSYWGEIFKEPHVTREEISQYSASAQQHIK